MIPYRILTQVKAIWKAPNVFLAVLCGEHTAGGFVELFVKIVRIIGTILDLLLAIGFFYGSFRFFRDLRRGINGITLALFVLFTGVGLRALRLASLPMLSGAKIFSELWRFFNIFIIALSFLLLDRETDENID